MAIIIKVWFSCSLYRIVAWAFTVKLLSDHTAPEVKELHQSEVNIGSGNGLVLSGTMPLPETVLTQIYVTICACVTGPQWISIGILRQKWLPFCKQHFPNRFLENKIHNTNLHDIDSNAIFVLILICMPSFLFQVSTNQQECKIWGLYWYHWAGLNISQCPMARGK